MPRRDRKLSRIHDLGLLPSRAAPMRDAWNKWRQTWVGGRVYYSVAGHPDRSSGSTTTFQPHLAGDRKIIRGRLPNGCAGMISSPVLARGFILLPARPDASLGFSRRLHGDRRLSIHSGAGPYEHHPFRQRSPRVQGLGGARFKACGSWALASQARTARLEAGLEGR